MLILRVQMHYRNIKKYIKNTETQTTNYKGLINIYLFKISLNHLRKAGSCFHCTYVIIYKNPICKILIYRHQHVYSTSLKVTYVKNISAYLR